MLKKIFAVIEKKEVWRITKNRELRSLYPVVIIILKARRISHVLQSVEGEMIRPDDKVFKSTVRGS